MFAEDISKYIRIKSRWYWFKSHWSIASGNGSAPDKKQLIILSNKCHVY